MFEVLILSLTGIIVGSFLIAILRDGENRLRGVWLPRDARSGRIYVTRKIRRGVIEYLEAERYGGVGFAGIGLMTIKDLRRFYWKAS